MKRRFKTIAFQVDIARQVETFEHLRQIIDFGASVGYNELFIHGEAGIEYKCHPELSFPWALTQKEFKELQDYAKKKYEMVITLILPVLGHAQYILKHKKFRDLAELKNVDDSIMKCDLKQLCTSNPGTLELAEELICEWATLYDSPFIHIGGDECWDFASCEVCRKSAEEKGRGKMLAEYFNSVNEIVKKYGKQTMIWQDMLFYYDNCIPLLDKDITICDWYYRPIERDTRKSIFNWEVTNSLQTYKNENLSSFICTKSKFDYFNDAHNIKTFIEYAESGNVSGLINTVWCMQTLPYAAAYPSLGYGAKCAESEIMPEPREYLNEFGKEHFTDGLEFFPMLVDIFAEIAEKPFFPGLREWIDYQDTVPSSYLAGKVAEAHLLLQSLNSKTMHGEEYREALDLIFSRMAISLQLYSLLNKVSILLRIAGKPNYPEIKKLLKKITENVEKIPAQIQMETEVWHKYRPKQQKNPIVVQLRNAQEEISSFANSINAVIDGKTAASDILPCVLELTLVNNDCSWQYLSISVSEDGKHYFNIGGYPQCGPSGRYTRTFPLPFRPEFVKFALGGLGKVFLDYFRIICADGILVPSTIEEHSANCGNPEHILTDNYLAASLGCPDTKVFFRQCVEQPLSEMTVSVQ